MSSEEKLSPEEIGRRITAGMGLVHDLFTEMNGFFRLVAEGLRDAEADIRVMTRGFLLPRAKKGRKIADIYMQTDMGFLAEIGGTATAETEEEVDTGDDVDDADVETDKTKISITPDSQYLAVRAVLYDPNVAADKFTPSVVAALFTSLSRVPLGKKASTREGSGPQTSFQLKRTGLRRMVKNLTLDVAPGQTMSARIVKARLVAEVAAVELVPLGEIDSEDRVAKFVERLVEMAENS